METKKTIIVSVLTTLATMLIVSAIMYLSCGQCGKNTSCSKANTECCADDKKCEKKKCHKSDDHDMMKEVEIEKEVTE